MSAGKSALINKMFHCNKLWNMAGFLFDFPRTDMIFLYSLLSLSIICNSAFSFNLSRTCTCPSSRRFLLYLMTMYFLSKSDVDPLMSPVCFLWVCIRGRRTRGERIASREEESEEARGWIAALFSAHVPHQQCSACNG